MSTYLVAFAISNFKYIENYAGPIRLDRIKHRIFYQNNLNYEKVKYQLEISEKLLDTMQEYFKTNYTLNKLEQIGIGSERNEVIAMENWGLIVYQ